MNASLLKLGFLNDWRRALFADDKLRKRAQLVGVYIARSCGGTDECSLSYSALAAATGLSRSEAIGMVRQLVDGGWLRKIETERRANTYKLLLNGTAQETIAAKTAANLGIRL
jgi:IclR helix-turn-helix domain